MDKVEDLGGGRGACLDLAGLGGGHCTSSFPSFALLFGSEVSFDFLSTDSSLV
jgi:hypothetical protein